MLAARGETAIDAALVDAALAIFLDRYREHLLDTTVPYPGIRALLASLRRSGVVLSVSTNKPHALSLAVLRGLGLERSFFDVIGGDSLPAHKPDPASVFHLAARAQRSLDETLVVGDSPVDVATARAAGVGVCAVTWGLTPRAALTAAAPDYLVDRPEDIFDLVND